MRPPNFIDLSGKRYGRLLVIAPYDKKSGMLRWECKCDCGNTTVVYGSNLRRGFTTSCGCYRHECETSRISKNTKHGDSGYNRKRLYGIWSGIISRCYNPNVKNYPYYGGRGITVCEEWKKDYVRFRGWALANGYEEGLSIDRIDVNGNYDPSNCRWASPKEQALNRSERKETAREMSITKTKTSTREEWLAERRKSLGGSDMGGVLGLSEYSSPYSVWAEKTGRVQPKEENEWMRLGNDLEGYVAQRFTEKSGLKVVNDKATWRNSKYPHLHANIDRKVVAQKAGVECKVTSSLNEKKYRDGKFPDRFYAQCVEYLCVTEFDRWYLVVLLYGIGLKIYQMTRIQDDTVPEWCESSVYVEDGEIEALATYSRDFWDKYVMTDIPPEADGSEATTKAISEVFSTSDGSSVSLMGYESDMEQYIALTKQITELTKLKDGLGNRVKAFMGNAARGESTRYKVSYTSRERRSFDADKFTAKHPNIALDEFYSVTASRSLRITEKGE